MSSQQTKSDGSDNVAEQIAAETIPPIAEVPNLVAPNIEFPSPAAEKVATMPAESENPVGRPIGFNEEIAEKILDAVVAGASLTQIGQRDDMPSDRTIGRWRRRFPEFDTQIIAAVKQSVFGLEDRALAEVRELPAEITEDDIKVERFKQEFRETNRKALLEQADRRKGDFAKMLSGAPGENAKVIDGDFEVVTTDEARFIGAIDADKALLTWERSTGIKSAARDHSKDAQQVK